MVVGYHYAHSLLLIHDVAASSPTVMVPTAHPEGAFHVGRVRQLFEHADGVICLSQEEAELVRRNHGCSDRISIVPPTVDDIHRPSADEIAVVCARYGLEPETYCTVVGRLDPAKGSDDVVRFTALYRDVLAPDLTVVAIGPGEANESTDGVVPVGVVDGAVRDALVAGTMAVIQPSYMESFSLSLMEGWLVERPAIVQQRSAVLAGHVDRSGGGLRYGDYLDFEAAMTLLRTAARATRAVGPPRRWCRMPMDA